MSEDGGKRDRGHGQQRQLPEIAAALEPWPADRFDQLDDHETNDHKGEEFRHAAFDQQRRRLSKRFVRSLTNNRRRDPEPECGARL